MTGAWIAARTRVQVAATSVLWMLFVGCYDQTATQYRGTITVSSSPERAAPMTLTLYSSTDTSFAGVARIGAPLDADGSVYAWHVGGELRFVTASASRDETILWSSDLTDEQIGGVFEILSGEREGETGTWRARLDKGSPASPSTLSSDPVTPWPPWHALWPIPLLVAALVVIGIRVRRHEAIAVPNDASAGATPAGRLPVGGFLLLFAVAQGIATLSQLLTLVNAGRQYRESIAVALSVPVMQGVIVLESLLEFVQAGGSLLGLVLITRRHPGTPRFWQGWLALLTSYLVLDLVAAVYYQQALAALMPVADRFDVAATNRKTTVLLVRQLVVNSIWLGYWLRSQRVRATFGGGTEGWIVGRPEAARRRWRSFGVASALLLVVAVTELWRRTPVIYETASEGELRELVEGRWSWSTETPTCGPMAHVIAFADSGNVMTITPAAADTGSTPDVTTYDIVLARRGVVRGAIRGETRLTSDGKPVVWDLVMTGRNEYRWRRTDWWSALGYTVPIVRCEDAPAEATTTPPADAS